MKRLGMLSVAVLLMAVNSGCAGTYANGLGPTERSRTGFGAKSDIELYGKTVELTISAGKNRRVERLEPLFRDFIESALIVKGAEPVMAGGTIKMLVTITDIETVLIVTVRLTEEGHTPSIVSEECGVPKYDRQASNISLDEYFLKAFKYAAGMSLKFL